MSYRILTKNAVENTNIDGARDHNFNAGRRSGIVKGALNSGNLFLSANNTIALDTCELRLCGHRVVIDSAEYKTFYNQPSVPIRYSLVAQIIVSNNGESVSFDLKTQLYTIPLVQNDLDKNINGTYELEIGRFTQLTDGTLTDVVRTADLITGGGNNDSEYIRIGTVTTNKISPELDADVDIENTINPDDNKPQTNFTFNLPTSVGTVVSVNGEEKTSINTDITPIASSENLITSGGVHDYPAVTFAESERQKSKNLFPVETVSGTTYTKITLPSRLKVGTYTLSLIATSSDTDVDRCVVSFQGDNDKFLGEANLGRNTRNNKTITLSENCYSINFYAGTSYANSNGDTFTYSDIQIEEGSVATDYQPYNGAIVHEKQIADVEHIETIYDMTSSDSNINWGYTSGISSTLVSDDTLASGEVFITFTAIDITKYKAIEMICVAGNENFTAIGYDYTYNSYRGGGGGYAYTLANSESFEFEFYIENAELKFRPRIRDANGTLSVLNNQYCFISKIRGILK